MKVQEHKAFRQILVNNEDQRRAACERILRDHGIECPLHEIRRVYQNILDRPKGTPKKQLTAIWERAQQELIRFIENFDSAPRLALKSVSELSEYLLDACYTSVNHPLFARIEELIRLGADVMLRDDFGNLAFRYLVVRFDSSTRDELGNTIYKLKPALTDELLQAFLEAGLDINADCEYHGKKTTFWICLAGVASRLWLEMMLAHGARINDRDSEGRNAMAECLAGRADPECVKFLMENGAERSVVAACGKTGLHEVVKTRSAGEKIILLLESGIDVNKRDQAGNTPLHLYAEASIDEEILRILLEHGADVNARNRAGDTPLHVAAGRCGSGDTVKALLAAGADANAKNDAGNTPLHVTACKWDYDTSYNAECLLEAGADPNSVSLTGDTPLLLAAGFNRQLVVSALVEHGADINLTNTSGKTAYEMALDSGYVDAARIINPSADADYGKTTAGIKSRQQKNAVIEKIKAGYLFEKGDREGYWELSWDPSHNPPAYRFYENDLGGTRTSWIESDDSAVALIGGEGPESYHLKKDPSRDLAEEARQTAQKKAVQATADVQPVDSEAVMARLGRYRDSCSFAMPLITCEDDLNRLMRALDTLHAHKFGYSDRHIAMKALIPEVFALARRHVHSLDDLLLLCAETPAIIENLPEDSEDSPVGRLYNYDLSELRARGLLALTMSEFVGAEPIMVNGKEIELL